jgi:hypothetical protein
MAVFGVILQEQAVHRVKQVTMVLTDQMETGSAGSANTSGTTNHIIKFTGATTGGTKVLMTGQTWNRNNDTSQTMLQEL